MCTSSFSFNFIWFPFKVKWAILLRQNLGLRMAACGMCLYSCSYDVVSNCVNSSEEIIKNSSQQNTNLLGFHFRNGNLIMYTLLLCWLLLLNQIRVSEAFLNNGHSQCPSMWFILFVYPWQHAMQFCL